MTAPELNDLREQLAELEPVVYPLDESPEQAVAHSVKLGTVAAICCEAFRRHGLWAVLVGGGVIELLLPGAYTTPDIDLVISQQWLRPPRPLVDHVFKELGFERQGARHWVRDGWFVEVPGFEITDPTTTVDIAGHQLDIVLIESVLVGRLVEYDQTGHTGHATQALMILEILGNTLNESELSRMARIEGVQDVLDSLRAFLRDRARTMVTDAVLREIRDNIHLRRRGAGPFPAGG
jgi:hypothetical protein